MIKSAQLNYNYKTASKGYQSVSLHCLLRTDIILSTGIS